MSPVEKAKRVFLTLTCICLMAGIMAFTPDAMAKKIFLNGVDITGLANKKFVNVSVRLDANGNVYITGEQYKVVKKYAGKTAGTAPKTTGQTAPQPTAKTTNTTAAGKFNKDYLLIMQRSTNKGSGYRLEISVNGKKVRKISVHMSQDVFKLNQYLKKGRNTIVIESYKVDKNATGTLQVQLSTGKIKNGKVFVKPPFFLTYKRQSTESNNYRHIFPITIR